MRGDTSNFPTKPTLSFCPSFLQEFHSTKSKTNLSNSAVTSSGNTFVLCNLDFGSFICSRSERPGIFLENREGDNSKSCCVDNITL